ncbi:MAG TPA: cytochrome D1 domain-containing protein, partial [Acidimicrobiales bacterium]
IKLDPQGRIFYVADRQKAGVHLIDTATFTEIGFIKTGADCHGLYPSRDARYLYVTNRGNGTVTLIDFAIRSAKPASCAYPIIARSSPLDGHRCSPSPVAEIPQPRRSVGPSDVGEGDHAGSY